MSSVTRRSLLTLARARPSAQSLAVRPSTLFARRYQSSDDFSPTGSRTPVPDAVNIQETGLNDGMEGDNGKMDWSRSFHGLSTEAFPKEVVDILTAPLDPEDVEIKPGNSHLLRLFMLLLGCLADCVCAYVQTESSTSPRSSTAAS
jgi:hypothetical protein